jgi:hypothetical protein
MRIARLQRVTIVVILILLAVTILTAIFRGKPKKLDITIGGIIQKTDRHNVQEFHLPYRVEVNTLSKVV